MKCDDHKSPGGSTAIFHASMAEVRTTPSYYSYHTSKGGKNAHDIIYCTRAFVKRDDSETTAFCSEATNSCVLVVQGNQQRDRKFTQVHWQGAMDIDEVQKLFDEATEARKTTQVSFNISV